MVWKVLIRALFIENIDWGKSSVYRHSQTLSYLGCYVVLFCWGVVDPWGYLFNIGFFMLYPLSLELLTPYSWIYSIDICNDQMINFRSMNLVCTFKFITYCSKSFWNFSIKTEVVYSAWWLITPLWLLISEVISCHFITLKPFL